MYRLQVGDIWKTIAESEDSEKLKRLARTTDNLMINFRIVDDSMSMLWEGHKYEGGE
jgi:hypothetical protein